MAQQRRSHQWELRGEFAAEVRLRMGVLVVFGGCLVGVFSSLYSCAFGSISIEKLGLICQTLGGQI